MKADLHIHSLYSNDGEKSVPELISLCLEQGVTLFSISDHNGTGAQAEAADKASGITGLDFIPGIEIDCVYEGTDLHLLGYQIDYGQADFIELEKEVEKKYLQTVPLMVENLARLGITVDQAKIMEKAGGKAPSAELFAEVLLAHPENQKQPVLKPYLEGGSRSDMPLINFYLDFFAQGKAAYVPVKHLPFHEAISLVRDHGGIPVVAHPGLNFKGREQMVGELLAKGAAGLEVFNNYHSREQSDYFAGLVKMQHGLMTCGSDFHGKTKPLIRVGQYLSLKRHWPYLEDSLDRLKSSSIYEN